MCIGCRCVFAKQHLVRLVRTRDSRVILDPGRKHPGRGAYLCQNPACWERALKRQSVVRALRIGTLHPDDRLALEQVAQRLKQTVQ
ncbi:MAG: YlxR family protein [Chloroflexaceae bacterium]|nr:YlxR family protein [Chloroflexaceae bacterium]